MWAVFCVTASAAALVLQGPIAPRRGRASAGPRCAAESSSEVHARITLLRHGQSEWNLANRFTGWVDVDLTERGITEARAAGRLLVADHQQHDLVVTSCLRRAVRTACLVLSGTNQCWLPVVKDARLNEQHPGALTGSNKRELAEEHGVEQVMRWRRNFDSPPPMLAAADPVQKMLQLDERYRDTGADVPEGESLRDTLRRVQELWHDTLAPALRARKNVLVVSHGNTLRALVKLLDDVSEGDSYHLDLPTACPVVYELDSELRPATGPVGFWGDSDAARAGRFLMSEEKVRRAQDMMRQQCLKNIAVSTVSMHADDGKSIEDTISTCDAWTAPTPTFRLVTLNGQSFNVRERPPSYFALESERLREQAKQELDSMLTQFQTRRDADGAAPVNGAAGLVPGSRPAKAVLVVLRHGYSEYNAENRFTGWADVELTNQGREEARLAGSLLREAGVRRLEKVYSSYLKRAIKTAWLMLDELELQWVPISYTWRLNERHYGALQGRPKRKCSEEYGVKQVQQWRRGVNFAPPPWDEPTAACTLDRRSAAH